MTFHHLKHQSNGGDNSVENGALLDITPHEYIHSLPRSQEEIVNNMLREYKINFMIMQNCKVIDSGSKDLSMEDFIEIPLKDNTPECNPYVQPKIKYKDRPKPFNRAKTKVEFQKTVNDFLEERD